MKKIIYLQILLVVVLGCAIFYQNYIQKENHINCSENHSPQNVEMIASEDGKNLYFHGIWTNGECNSTYFRVLEQDPSLAIHVPKERDEKVEKIKIAKYARFITVERDTCDSDEINVLAAYPNLKEVQIEAGNPYLKMNDNKLYELDSSTGKVRKLLGYISGGVK